jgi:hypothetical protein
MRQSASVPSFTEELQQQMKKYGQLQVLLLPLFQVFVMCVSVNIHTAKVRERGEREREMMMRAPPLLVLTVVQAEYSNLVMENKLLKSEMKALNEEIKVRCDPSCDPSLTPA